MRYVLIIFSFIVSVFIFSCEDAPIINCSDCLSEEPKNASVEIIVDNMLSQIIIEVFSGNLEDMIYYDSFQADGKKLVLTLPLNNQYTITATYVIDGKRYVAVDSAFPRVKFSKDQCDDPCYYVYDKSVNLKLKYKD